MPSVCWKLGLNRPLLVTDLTISRQPFVKRLLKSTRKENIDPGVFSEIEAEPDGACVVKGAKRFIQGNYNGIIAVGGGSVLDAGKAIALCATVGPGNMWKYSYDRVNFLEAPPTAIPPVLAVPTTAGTGSEVDGNAVITDESRGTKVSIYHPDLLPRIVIADPELTLGLIPYLTAATGMDALSHNLEALCSPVFHPILDAIAIQGIQYIKQWLLVAFNEKKNREARVYLMAASIMGAIAFEKGLGAMHANAHAYGGLYKTRHGRTIAAVMPYVLKFNRKSIEPKMEDLARYLDLPRHSFDALLDWIFDLRRELGMPISLKDLGVKKEDIGYISQNAYRDANIATNPLAMDEKKLEKLVKMSITGRI